MKRKLEDYEKFSAKVQKIDWNNLPPSKYFPLPVHPAVQLHDCFPTKDKEEIPLLNRESTNQLYDKILSCVGKQPPALYVQGPIGMCYT